MWRKTLLSLLVDTYFALLGLGISVKSRLLFRIDLLAFYVTICLDDHFCYRNGWLLDERLIEVFHLDTILERPHEHFLVWG